MDVAVVETLGDSNILVRFFGWVDQTAYDFLKVRSAALVAVKTALDDAGIEMPEPIFRVRTVAMEQPVDRHDRDLPLERMPTKWMSPPIGRSSAKRQPTEAPEVRTC